MWTWSGWELSGPEPPVEAKCSIAETIPHRFDSLGQWGSGGRLWSHRGSYNYGFQKQGWCKLQADTLPWKREVSILQWECPCFC